MSCIYISIEVQPAEISVDAELVDDIAIDIELPIVATPLVCDDVVIEDQDGNEIATVPSGGTYTVLVFSGIVDNGPPYTNSIIDQGT